MNSYLYCLGVIGLTKYIISREKTKHLIYLLSRMVKDKYFRVEDYKTTGICLLSYKKKTINGLVITEITINGNLFRFVGKEPDTPIIGDWNIIVENSVDVMPIPPVMLPSLNSFIDVKCISPLGDKYSLDNAEDTISFIISESERVPSKGLDYDSDEPLIIEND